MNESADLLDHHKRMNYSEGGEIEVKETNTDALDLSHMHETSDGGVFIPPNLSRKFGKKRHSIQYTSDKCKLQTSDTPYYVALAARIFGIEAQEADEGEEMKNFMNLPFDWQPNERISEDQFNATNNLCLWTQMPSSITSVNLTICLVKELHDSNNLGDFLIIWAVSSALPVAMAFFVELATVTALSEDYEDIDQAAQENFCQQDVALQCGVVGIFLISLLKPFYDILTEVVVGLSSFRCVYDTIALQQIFIHVAGPQYGRGRKFIDTTDNRLIVKEVETGPFSFFIYWASVAIEAYVFYLTVVVGVYYTMSQQDASSIVQAAVAISFINEIDNILYEAICTQELKDVMNSCVYEVPLVPHPQGGGEKWWQFFLRQHQMMLQTPVLIILTWCIVSSLRFYHCHNEEYYPYSIKTH